MEHTKEPWNIGGGVIYGADKTLVADVYLFTTKEKGNDRRIVACVNALAGIPTSALESGVIGEMVEALAIAEKNIVNLYRSLSPHANSNDGNAFADKDSAIKVIRAILAKLDTP